MFAAHRNLTIVEGDRERPAVTRRGRGKTVCACGSNRVPACGPTHGGVKYARAKVAFSRGACAAESRFDSRGVSGRAAGSEGPP